MEDINTSSVNLPDYNVANISRLFLKEKFQNL